MANVLHKRTLTYLTSVNTIEYMNGEWIINPQLPNCDKKYWKIVGDEVVEMTPEEKSQKDLQERQEMRYMPKSKMQILNEIWGLTTPITQPIYRHLHPYESGYDPNLESGNMVLVRPADSPEEMGAKIVRRTKYVNLLNNHPILLAFLEDHSYNAARQYLSSLVGSSPDAELDEQDYELFDSILPLER